MVTDKFQFCGVQKMMYYILEHSPHVHFPNLRFITKIQSVGSRGVLVEILTLFRISSKDGVC
jgi:hypothetical protein